MHAYQTSHVQVQPSPRTRVEDAVVVQEFAQRLATTDSLEHLARFLQARTVDLRVFIAKPTLWHAYKRRFETGAKKVWSEEHAVDAELEMHETLFRLLWAARLGCGEGANWLGELANCLGRAWLEGEYGRWVAELRTPRHPTHAHVPCGNELREAVRAANELSDHPGKTDAEFASCMQETLDRFAGLGLRSGLRLLNATQLSGMGTQLPEEIAERLGAEVRAWGEKVPTVTHWAPTFLEFLLVQSAGPRDRGASTGGMPS